MAEANAKSETPTLTKKQVKAYLADIEKKVIEQEGADMASLIALNELLTLPNAEKLLDGELRTQMKDLWIKLKANGIQVDDPPLLFGLPEDFGAEEVVEEEELAVVAQAVEPAKKKPKPKPKPEVEVVVEEDDGEEPLPH